MSAIEVDPGDVVALFALVIAIWSAWQTQRFNRRQTAFQETAEQLNRLLVQREAAEQDAQKRAEVSANFYKSGKHDYRVKVFNRGPNVARNVRLEVLDDADLVHSGDLARKFPVPSLDRHQSVELIARVHMQSPSRTHVRLTWDDEEGAGRMRELHLSW